MQAVERWKRFSKNSYSDLDLESKTPKVKLAQDIIIPNICVKSYYNPSKNVGAKAMTKFFSKRSHNDLDLEPRPES